MTCTIERSLAQQAMESAVADEKRRRDCPDIFRHEDGSVTVVFLDPLPSDTESPRDHDGNIATMVNEHRDYREMDAPDSELAEARERWDYLEHNGHPHHAQPRVFPYHNPGEAALIRGGYDRTRVIERYIAMFRPDILHYQDEWTVSGSSQSDWQNGWGYVTREDWEAAMGTDYDGDVTPAEAFEQERKVYELWFAGEVYGAVHLSLGDPIVVYGEHGAYIDGYEINEDDCYGFLGYDNLRDIAGNFTSSPVTEED